jgi:hypothetical protein
MGTGYILITRKNNMNTDWEKGEGNQKGKTDKKDLGIQSTANAKTKLCTNLAD